jgi:hypothetical protein
VFGDLPDRSLPADCTLPISGSVFRYWSRLAAGIFAVAAVSSCAIVQSIQMEGRLTQTRSLVQEVKEFGRSIGIEPTAALSRTSRQGSALSMVWLWLQRAGTLAVRAPIDIRMAIGFSVEKDEVKVEQVYRVEGYSVYYRQGNEFADPRALTTFSFADEGIVRRVKVVLHEDLHGDKNFDLPWEIEESIVTPLGSLAAVEFFRHKGDAENVARALTSLEEERRFSSELNELVTRAEIVFKNEAAEAAKKRILDLIAEFPVYQRHFERQIARQHPPTVLEAKLSHDLAYYRFHNTLVYLHERAGSLRTLIEDLKQLPRISTHEDLEKYLQDLEMKYAATRNHN